MINRNTSNSLAARIRVRNEYTTFGSIMEGRSYEGDTSLEYRFGFNGKEKDDETGTQDYGMRIYNNSLGRFLSVDPLTKNFPWNSTYAFAENDIIRCIDLEGGEKLEVNITNNPSANSTGTAKIIISLDYYVVTIGVGAVANANKLDPVQFHNTYKSGNTTLYMKSLPSPQSEPQYLSGRDLSWARKADKALFKGRREKFKQKLEKAGVLYYKVNVEYNYNLIIKSNTTLNDAYNEVQKDPHGIGLVSDAVNPGMAGLNPMFNKTFRNSNATALVYFNSKTALIKDIDALGVGSNEQEDGGHENFIFINPNNTRGLTNIAVHEAGHNSAFNHLHNTGQDYEYSTSGLSSNGDANSLSPSQSNTNSILKDKSNRSTIK